MPVNSYQVEQQNILTKYFISVTVVITNYLITNTKKCFFPTLNSISSTYNFCILSVEKRNSRYLTFSPEKKLPKVKKNTGIWNVDWQSHIINGCYATKYYGLKIKSSRNTRKLNWVFQRENLYKTNLREAACKSYCAMKSKAKISNVTLLYK